MYQRTDGETKTQLESRVVRRLLALRNLSDKGYTNQSQCEPRPDQIVFDHSNAPYCEMELFGTGDQQRSAEMNMIVNRLRDSLSSSRFAHLQGHDILLECKFRQPSKQTQRKIIGEVLCALQEPSVASFIAPTHVVKVPKAIANYIANISLRKRAAGTGRALLAHDYLGDPANLQDAIEEVWKKIREKCETPYRRSRPDVPLELLVHSAGFSDIRWTPQFLDELQRKLERNKATWCKQFNSVWLLTENDYRQVKCQQLAS